jgi:hypothetical protein
METTVKNSVNAHGKQDDNLYKVCDKTPNSQLAKIAFIQGLDILLKKSEINQYKLNTLILKLDKLKALSNDLEKNDGVMDPKIAKKKIAELNKQLDKLKLEVANVAKDFIQLVSAYNLRAKASEDLSFSTN